MRVRCARGTPRRAVPCRRYINAARVPVYSSPCQEDATNHRRWYTAADRLFFMSAIVMKHQTRVSRSKVPISLSFHDYMFVSGDPSRHSLQWGLFSATLAPMISISLEQSVLMSLDKKRKERNVTVQYGFILYA